MAKRKNYDLPAMGKKSDLYVDFWDEGMQNVGPDNYDYSDNDYDNEGEYGYGARLAMGFGMLDWN